MQKIAMRIAKLKDKRLHFVNRNQLYYSYYIRF